MYDGELDDGHCAVSFIATGQQLLLQSIAIPGLPFLLDQPTSDKEESYLTKVSRIVEWLQGLGGNRTKQAE